MVRKPDRQTDRHINQMGKYIRRLEIVMQVQLSQVITLREASPRT